MYKGLVLRAGIRAFLLLPLPLQQESSVEIKKSTRVKIVHVYSIHMQLAQH